MLPVNNPWEEASLFAACVALFLDYRCTLDALCAVSV